MTTEHPDPAAAAGPPADGRVHVLPETLANQIAAGEVVERPASVVKELVENALDAEALRVDVEIEDGGRTLVRVTDDGAGMGPADAVLCLRRFATSKVASYEDLHAIGTLGFRGEALPSIASVSRFELETRRQSGPDGPAPHGVRVVCEGGAAPVVSEAGVPPGTRVTVRDLFYNVPARRKFLRAVATEAGRVSAMIASLALGHPHVHFRLVHNGRTVLDLPPERSLAPRAAAALGRDVAGKLHPVVRDEGGLQVEGLVSAPTCHRPNNDGIHTFINGRPIRDRTMQHAILVAYGGMLDRGRYPYAVVSLRIAPEQVDVNVHPTKSEVRFADSGAVHGAVLRAVQATLSAAPWVAGHEPPPATRLAPRALAVAPVDEDAAQALPLSSAGVPSAACERRAGYAPRSVASVSRGAGGRASSSAAPPLGARSFALEFGPPPAGPTAPRDTSAPAAPPASAGGFFASLRYVGQVRRTYLVCETADALHVIDQHAAHERVAYETLRAGLEDGRLVRQQLLLPLVLEFTPSEVAAVETHEAFLARLGFELEVFGEREVRLSAVPSLFVNADYARLVRDLAAELTSLDQTRAVADRLDALAARLACHGAVRGGDALTPAEVQHLLVALDGVAFRGNCPHGRPVVVSYPFTEVARWFERG